LRWDDPGIDAHLLETIEHERIDLVLSNVDSATAVHARLRGHSAALRFCVDLSAAETCLSKLAFQTRCEDLGLPIAPRADLRQFPFFAKPDRGSSSEGAQAVLDERTLAALEHDPRDFIFQVLIEGVEYSVDAYVDQAGIPRGVSVRSRDAVSGGESVISTTVDDPTISDLSRHVIAELGLSGPLTLQFIRAHMSGELFLIEVNPRFGGGVPLSIEAGFDFPKMMLCEALGQPLETVAHGRRLRMTRYLQEYFHAADR
jgi:carbamoyl-phosphate synthase large subunit